MIATFDSVGLLAPRGRFEVEMYLTSMKLLGQVSRPWPDLSDHLEGVLPHYPSPATV